VFVKDPSGNTQQYKSSAVSKKSLSWKQDGWIVYVGLAAEKCTACEGYVQVVLAHFLAGCWRELPKRPFPELHVMVF
jgi:hypothetical protein